MQEYFAKLRNYIFQRRFWILAAFIFFVLEMWLMIRPGGWARENLENYLTGEGMWLEQITEEDPDFCQEFIPESRNIKSIGIYLVDQTGKMNKGKLLVFISDESDNVLFKTEIPYEELQSVDNYIDIDINLILNPKNTYYLSVIGDDGGKEALSIGVCGMEYPMYENKVLQHNDTVIEGQLITRYRYTDAIRRDILYKVIFLCVITAFGIAFGLPENRIFRRIVGIGILLVSPYILGVRLELLTINLQFLLPFALKWSVAILYLVELVILLCTHSPKITIIIFNLVITLIYSVNFFVFTYRGVPFRIADLKAIGTAAEVVENYNLNPNIHMAMAWCIMGVFIVYGFYTGDVRKKSLTWKHAGSYLVTILLAVGLLLVMRRQLLYTDLLQDAGFVNFHGLDQYIAYHFDGFIVGSCMDIINSRVEEPKNYSASEAENILRESIWEPDAEEDKDLPHIILVMNESLADLRVLGNLQLNEDNLPFTNSLKENTIRGYVNASVLGGGTANSEFEVFTGCTMGFLPASSYVYQQWMVRPVDSLVSIMKDSGYSTWSIHPARAENWNRKQVYRLLGFDNSLWVEDFEGAQIIHSGVSDLETFNKIEEIYENRQAEEKLFIFDLTIQNHGGYEASDIEKTVYGVNVNCEEADIFLSLVKESDKAFKSLIDYFEQTDEKVLICMFGDHQPIISDESFYNSIYEQTEGLSDVEKVFNQYKTPFVIWANYDIPEKENLDISMNYLGVLILQTAHISASPYFDFLGEYMDRYPIITVNGYQDNKGKYYNWSGNNEELSEYRILQYNYLFDENTVKWGYKK